MREEVDVLGSSSLTVPTVTVEVKQQLTEFSRGFLRNWVSCVSIVSLYDHLAVNIWGGGGESLRNKLLFLSLFF